ncbi:MAG: bifunctional phosphopantothenoylcysteine decarboxylase/phosphopantothenate--cysteine ligase CoaBC [candidate division WOR-3 bacterium]|nr:bifunctional phosphopantothenoylcysteine decarboxylase/phosphopantothenate--cysteine ligase CoaBC [candidate division WOR-3 bacterium]
MKRSKNIHENILLGITGSIAAYKIPELIRRLQKEGHSVRVIMTDNARHFAGKSAIETLTGTNVYDTLWADRTDTEHIKLSQWADILVIAPATANMLGKCANGIADDLLSTVFLSFDGPVIFVPAMNTKMYNNAIVSANIERLIQFGYEIMEPASGELACGDTGKGRMPQPMDIVYRIKRVLGNKKFKGKNILVTGGAFSVWLDPVRTITNMSSGKTGRAFALQSYIAGADNVTLIEGSASEEFLISEIELLKCSSAEELKDTLISIIDNYDILIMCAAVPDFTTHKSKSKIKASGSLELKMTKGIDILKSIKDKSIVKIGFALETDNPKDNALKKLEEKSLDYIVLNSPDNIGSIRGSATVLSSNGEERIIEDKTKPELAREILNWIE